MHYKYSFLLLLMIFLIGCSQADNPASPGLQSSQPDFESAKNAPYLWGLWDIEYDPGTSKLTVTPLRNASGTWNVTMFLQPPAGSPTGLGVEILDASNLVSEGRIDVRVTVNHPFPGPKLRGFDVRGVVMGNGSITDTYNTDLVYTGPDDLQLLNADGYTRWMNAPEFIFPGILGYTPGALGTNNFNPSATINGYKYFAELIEPDQSVYDYFATSLAYVTNRGSFTPGTSIARDYHLKFPTSPLQIRFQYAILTGWEKATSGGDTPSPLDFPNEANAFEPVGLEIEDNSFLYVENPDKKGGYINLKLSIVDWWAAWDPVNLSDYISKIIISSDQIDLSDGLGVSYQEFDFSSLTHYPTSAGNAEAIDILVPEVMPAGLENQSILIAIEMSGYDYLNPYGVPNNAAFDPLTGYFLHAFEVATEYNDPPVIVSGVNGNANVFIADTETYTVNATDEDSPTITYEWTARDPLSGEILYGPSMGNSAGSWELDWADADIPGEVEVHCVVSDEENQVSADPLLVAVDDVIFHADLQDTVTGDNSGWTTTESQGISHWTSFVGQDNILQGHGYKFAPFNTIYLVDSADILVTPEIPIPTGIERVIAVVFHSYEFEWDTMYEIGFDGGNFKVTQSPALPTYSDPEQSIIAGKDYDNWLFDTAIDNQLAFSSDQFTDELLVSAFEIPQAFIGTNIHLGFAAATDYADLSEYHGWLIDDVQIRALPVDGNGPPIPGGGITGDDTVPMLAEYPGEYQAFGYDLEDDPLSFIWTIRIPGSGEIIWGPFTGDITGEMTIDWTVVGIPYEYEVHCSIYDGSNPGVPVPPLTVTVQEPIFHADFSDTSTGNNAGWAAINEFGMTSWTTDVGSDGILNGYGYKWGDFSTSYVEDSRGILQSPWISIPSGISRVSVYVRHDFQFLATLDGGNFKIIKSPVVMDFTVNEENIDGGFDYDVKMNGTVMDNQDAFGIGATNDNGLVSRMDLASSYFGSEIRLGIAVVSGVTAFNMRGWLIDDVVVTIVE